MIELENVTKWYASTAAIKEFSLNIDSGQFVFFQGHNGAGKSTLLRLISGIEKADEGVVKISGFNLSSQSDFFELKKQIGIGYLCEDSLLYDDLPIRESFTFFQQLRYVTRECEYQDINELCDSLRIAKALNCKPKECSQGMLKKASFIAAIIGQPGIILLDEPFSSLDNSGIEACVSILKNLHAQGKTILISSHSKDFYGLNVDEIFFLENGKLRRGKVL